MQFFTGFKEFISEVNHNPLQGLSWVSAAGTPVGVARSAYAGMQAAGQTYNKLSTGNAYTANSARRAIQGSIDRIMKIFKDELIQQRVSDPRLDAKTQANKLIEQLIALRKQSAVESKPGVMGGIFAVPAAVLSGLYVGLRDSLHSILGHDNTEGETYWHISEILRQFGIFLEASNKLSNEQRLQVIDGFIEKLTPYTSDKYVVQQNYRTSNPRHNKYAFSGEKIGLSPDSY